MIGGGDKRTSAYYNILLWTQRQDNPAGFSSPPANRQVFSKQISGHAPLRPRHPSLLATRYSLLATRYLLLATCYLLLATCFSLLNIFHLVLATYIVTMLTANTCHSIFDNLVE